MATLPSSLTARSAVLVDYDNFFDAVLTSDETVHALNRIVAIALKAGGRYAHIDVRLYGGWLEDGLLTRRGSAVQASLARPFFPMPHPDGRGLLRGSVSLVTRLHALPHLEWGHTYRTRRGLPRLRLTATPRPRGCAGVTSCPIDLVQRITRRRGRKCHIAGCEVTNEAAFEIREQKMVDSLLCCDALALAPHQDVIVASDDLDLVPPVATAACLGPHQVLLIRSTENAESLYDAELDSMGVTRCSWETV